MEEINVATNLHSIRQRISAAEKLANRDAGSVALLAVSKTKPDGLIRAAWNAGQRAFGENYAQEAEEKARRLADLSIEWHFIGPIQSNKTRGLAQTMAWVHSIDRLKIAQRLSDQRPEHLPPLNICVQIKLSDEPSKSGVASSELPNLAEQIVKLPKLRLRGLMAIPAATADYPEQRMSFSKLQGLLFELQKQHPQADTLSMGMSGDLEAAVVEGSTLVRVGTDIFGAR
ncbi:MAG: YggS family pyridoxal phosphate-dependent enzyme [Luminiphilus sp.]|nr:YggS family pyridoxal phosphate-dependent enzyme [Luminiphilus sp.]